MIKTIYVVREMNARGDDFDQIITFDLDEARKVLEDRAFRGYHHNGKSPETTTYYIFGYNIDTNEIDEDTEYDINDAKSLYIAYVESVFHTEPDFEEKYEER